MKRPKPIAENPNQNSSVVERRDVEYRQFRCTYEREIGRLAERLRNLAHRGPYPAMSIHAF